MRRKVTAGIVLLVIASSCAYWNDAEPAMCTANGRVYDILVLGDRVFVAGDFSQLIDPDGTTHTRHGIGACDLDDGGDVAGWNARLKSGASVRTIETSADGSLVYVGGQFTKTTPARVNAAAFAVTNAAANGWAPSPALSTGTQVNDIVRAGAGVDEQVYLGGWFDVRLYRGPQHASAGQQVTSFDVTIDGFVLSMAMAANGVTLFVGGGNITAINGTARSGAGAVNAQTGVTRAFAPDLNDPNPADPEVQVYDIIVAGGQVYLCGDWWQTEGIGMSDPNDPEAAQDQRNVNRFNATTGVADRGWWPRTNGGIQACALDTDAGVLLIGGHFEYVNGLERDDLATLELAGGANFAEPVVQPWDPITATANGAYAATIGPNGHAFVGGSGQLGADSAGNPRNAIAVFPPDIPE